MTFFAHVQPSKYDRGWYVEHIAVCSSVYLQSRLPKASGSIAQVSLGKVFISIPGILLQRIEMDKKYFHQNITEIITYLKVQLMITEHCKVINNRKITFFNNLMYIQIYFLLLKFQQNQYGEYLQGILLQVSFRQAMFQSSLFIGRFI